MSDPLEMKQLKNGGEAPASAVWTTMISLKDMMTGGGIPSILAVVDLAEYCRNGKEITGRSRDLLVQRGLMKDDGRVHDIVRDVILSAGQGEGLTFSLGSPYAE